MEQGAPAAAETGRRLTQDEVRADYTARVEAARAEAEACDRDEARLADLRLGTFAVAVAITIGAAVSDFVSWLWLLVPAATFVMLVAAHARRTRERLAAERRAALHARGLDRLDGTWAGKGPDGAAFLDSAHPYAEHLDVLGPGSLFQMMCAARTPQGEEALASFLCHPVDFAEARRRQRAVTELRPRVDLREDVALLGTTAATATGLDRLPQWGGAEPRFPSSVARLAAVALPLATIALLLVAGATDLSFAWALIPFGLGFAVIQAAEDDWAQVLGGVESVAHDLDLLAALTARIEREEVHAPLLVKLKTALTTGDVTASHAVDILRRRLNLADAGRNQFFIPIALMLLWPIHMAVLLEKWRAQFGPHVEDWLEAVGEFEAVASVAAHAYEHPGDVFAEFVEDALVFDGEGLAHPLLIESRAVRNDLRLDADARVVVVSGSNMSGKSTLLRTVGTNAVLALAGAPVRARRLRLSQVTVAASIQVHDSLIDGESRFYAEVSRVGQIVKLASQPGCPLLFLLDELFHGTNSHDRRIGAAALVRVLAERGAVGLLTTHDLELARIAEDLDAAVVNVHFEDQYEDGRMSFDYSVKPGVVERSNALALMRAVGIDV